MARQIIDGRLECSSCHDLKPVIDFHKSKSSSTGLLSACKVCVNATHKRWRDANPEKVRTISRASARRFYDKHREELLAKQATQWAEQPEKMRTIQDKYHVTHPERARLNVLAKYGLTPELFTELLTVQHECCGICGVSMRYVDSQEYDAVVDHEGPMGPECTVRGLLHHTCNGALSKRRHKLTPEEQTYLDAPPCLRIPALALRLEG